jgi:hypothetical protein
LAYDENLKPKIHALLMYALTSLCRMGTIHSQKSEAKMSRIHNQPLSLEELRVEAQKTHRVIRRDGESAWRPIKYWKGSSDGVVYYLLGNTVIARTAQGGDEHKYTLW